SESMPRQSPPAETVQYVSSASQTAQLDEPMDLGGADSPMIEAVPERPGAMRDVARPKQRERKGMFGMFGRRRSDEHEQAPDQTSEAERAQRNRKANPQATAQQPAPQAPPQAGLISARTAAEDLRKAQPADDLFDGVTE